MNKLRKYKRRRFIILRLKELVKILEKELPKKDWYYLLESKYRDILRTQC